MAKSLVVIFGGGFVAKNICHHLLKKGYLVRICVRRPHNYGELLTMAKVGQLNICQTNIKDPNSIKHAIKDADYVINTVGILANRGKQNFQTIHVDGARDIAYYCNKENVKKFIHFSALIDEDNLTSKYAQSKFEGEKAILKNFKNAVLIRPSLIFGREDDFFNYFGNLSVYLPIMPLLGGGKTKFQPIYINDICLLVEKILALQNKNGFVVEAAGAKKYSLKDLFSLILKTTNRKPILFPMPLFVGYILAFLASIVYFIFPKFKPFFSVDNLKSLKFDSVIKEKSKYKNMSDFDINPTALEPVIAEYLWVYREYGEFAKNN